MIKPTAIDHIVLSTEKYQALIDFYCDVIGCSIERETSGSFGLTQLRAGNSLIDIIDVHGELGQAGGPAPQTTGQNVDHFCLQIAPYNEDELLNHLRQYGVEFSEFQERYGAQGMGRSIYIKDAAGNKLELRAHIT